jgi:hypothetical protein
MVTTPDGDIQRADANLLTTRAGLVAAHRGSLGPPVCCISAWSEVAPHSGAARPAHKHRINIDESHLRKGVAAH